MPAECGCYGGEARVLSTRYGRLYSEDVQGVYVTLDPNHPPCHFCGAPGHRWGVEQKPAPPDVDPAQRLPGGRATTGLVLREDHYRVLDQAGSRGALHGPSGVRYWLGAG